MPPRRIPALATLILLPAALAACRTPPDGDRPVTTLEAKLAQFAPAVLEADLDSLPGSERAALIEIIEAARPLDELFLRQAGAGNLAIRQRLAADESAEGKRRLRYFDIMKGPWDRQDHWRPFATTMDRPPGAGFYPEDLLKVEFEEACAASPEQKAALASLTTVVRRGPGRTLAADPYSKVFAAWLEPAARRLEAAAALTAEPTLARFLRSRAAAFRSDDYYESDKDWMDLQGRVEVTIGPYETYEDELLGLKASFEAFVTVTDPEASAALDRWKAGLAEWERSLPIPDRYKSERGRESPIRVVDLVYASGDARKSVQTIAFNLPNDERVRAEKGAKKVLLRNLIRSKFDLILRPIAERILAEGQLPLLSSDAFFHQVLFHELSHSLGPAYAERGGIREEVRTVLGAHYSALEECKADVMGAFHLLGQVRAGAFPAEFRDQVLVSYFIGLFRSVRFGLAEAHGKGAAIQISTYLRDGAATVDESTGRLAIDLARIEDSNRALLTELLLLQAEGDTAAAERMLAERAVLAPAVAAALGRLDGVPVDLRPVYPAAGERR